MVQAHLFTNILFNGIVVGYVNLIKINGVVRIRPHVVFTLHMPLKTLQYYHYSCMIGMEIIEAILNSATSRSYPV